MSRLEHHLEHLRDMKLLHLMTQFGECHKRLAHSVERMRSGCGQLMRYHAAWSIALLKGTNAKATRIQQLPVTTRRQPRSTNRSERPHHVRWRVGKNSEHDNASPSA
jgi:hypothetical protein